MLAKLGEVKKFNIDENVCNIGEAGHEMYIILKGKVGVYINSIDGFPIKVTELSSGDFFGEMSLLESMPRSANIEALEDTFVLAINENNFERIIAQQPNLAFRIMKGMSNRLRKQNEELSRSKQATSEDCGPSDSTQVSVQVLDGSIFPPNHKNYFIIAPGSDSELLFDREIECPVCGEGFMVKSVRNSKLRLDRVDNDMRQRFFDFEPLWYMVWVCPHCYYANFNFEFKQILSSHKKKIIEQAARLQDKIKLHFSQPRKIDEVFAAYYLMMQSIQVGTNDVTALAKVWLRLSWLYKDVADEKMFKFASKQALDMFKESYYNSCRDTSIEQEQRLALLLGELNLRLDEEIEAIKFFRNALVRKPGGNKVINRQAEDRISELKNKISNE